MTPKKSSKLFHTIIAAATGLFLAASAYAAGPNFGPAIYGDGVTWGTKGNADLPAPNAHNAQSFDGLFKFTNGIAGQLAVSEAAPGNPMYNGGRWDVYTVTWNVTPYLITNYEDLMMEWALGNVTITKGEPADGQPHYFQCPLLPNKQG
jgi:hypothetical protein